MSMVSFVVTPAFDGVLLHLSGLSPHTRHLRAEPRASLLIAEPERPDVDDVQTLARITLNGTVAALARDADGYTQARELYLGRLPNAAMWFDFPDFVLFRFTPAEARFVGGFARAYTLTPDHLRQSAAL